MGIDSTSVRVVLSILLVLSQPLANNEARAASEPCIGDAGGNADCRPPDISEFVYVVEPGGPMPPACINVGPFATEGEAKEAALSALICASPAVCSTTRAGEDPWGLLAYRFPAYPMSFRKALHYTTTFWNNVVPNCDRQGSAGITIRKDRRVECPFGYQPDTTWDHCLRSTQADCGPCDTRGNPVNVLSAEKVQTEIDYLSGAPSGISFIRHYRSYGHAARDTGRTSGMLGNYWRTNLDRTVSIGMAGTNTVAHVDRLDGPVKSFVLTNGDWVPHTDKQSRLQTVMNSSGSLAGWFYARVYRFAVRSGLIARTYTLASWRWGIIKNVTNTSIYTRSPILVTIRIRFI